MQSGVVVNKALEEFRERLLRWSEQCEQLRELYYKYLDLAAFRSEKCYFPGRRCERPWGREYDIGNLTLMWTYIANTAPLCGKLMRTLAKVEERFRRLGVEGLKKGYVVGKSRPDKARPRHEIVTLYLERPIYATVALWGKRLYVFYGDVPIDSLLKGHELEKLAKESVQAGIPVEVYDVDEEYKRLWLEVPLPGLASRLLGGSDRAPIALFRNLGWLLSDDRRQKIGHSANNPGQIAVRLFDWIALAKYTMEKGIVPEMPLVFTLTIHKFTRTENGHNPTVDMWAIGTAYVTLNTVYNWFGIMLRKTEEVLMRGYAVLKALREEAFKRGGKMYVVDDVGAWIAFSNAVATLVLGDGYVLPYEARITVKSAPRATLEGKTSLLEELAEAVGGSTSRDSIRLQTWHMRLLLPTPPTPAYEKAAKLFETLVNYPAAAVVEVGNNAYLLYHNGSGEFAIGRRKAPKLYETVKQLALRARFRDGVLELTYAQLEELARLGFTVRLLNDMEKDAIREVKPALLTLDLYAIRQVLEEVVKMARISIKRSRGREYIYIALYDKSRLEEIATMLKAVGIRLFAVRQKGVIYIREQRSVEAIRKAITYIFYNTSGS